MVGQIPVPYRLLPPEWKRAGQPQQELPNDDPVGISPFARFYADVSRDANSRVTVPFWDELIATMDPGNAQIPAWNVVRLAGETLPGICDVTGKVGKRFDVKKAKGSNFATLTHQGSEPAQIKVVERIWTRQQLLALWAIMPILRNTSASLANGKIQACDIRNPQLDLMEIGAVVVSTISVPHLSASQKGVVEIEYDMLEYKPKDTKDRTGTANGSVYDVGMKTDQSRVSLTPLTPTKKPFTDAGPNGARGR